MDKRLWKTIFAILLLPVCVQAVPITIAISGNVTSASGSGNGLPGTIHVGDIFTGTYTYDSSTIDSGGGHHLHNAPYGIDLSLGGYEFKTAPGHVEQFDMWIMNDYSSNGVKDFYIVRSEYQNISIPSVGFNISSIYWELWDTTHTALSSGDLPVTAPVLTDWNYNYFEIYGYDGTNGIWIRGTVTQAVIPEPLTIVLMITGVFLLKRRR